MNEIYWKASCIDNLTDARFFNALDDAWLEFVFDALDNRAVTIQQAKEIIDWLFEPQVLASFGNHQSPEEIFHVLQETGISYAAVQIEHELAADQDFVPLAFIKLSINQLDAALALEHKPFAFVIKQHDLLASSEIANIQQLLQTSRVFLDIPLEDNSHIKSQLKEFESIGIEIQTEPENSPGMSAVDVYDYFIEALEQ